MLKPFFVYQNKGLKSIKPEDVVCLVADKNYTKIHLSNKTNYLVRSTLTGVLKKLPPEIFIKIHRSCAVSINFIDRLERDHLEIGGASLPIGRHFYKKLIEQLNIIE